MERRNDKGRICTIERVDPFFFIRLYFSIAKYSEFLSFNIFNQQYFTGIRGDPETVIDPEIHNPGYVTGCFKDPDVLLIRECDLIVDEEITDFL